MSTSNINQLSKIDEERAQREAIEYQKKYDDIIGKSEAQKMMQDTLCRKQNLDGVQQRMAGSLKSTVREK